MTILYFTASFVLFLVAVAVATAYLAGLRRRDLPLVVSGGVRRRVCFKMVVQAGIARVVYRDPYRPDDKVLDVARRLEIQIEALGDG